MSKPRDLAKEKQWRDTVAAWQQSGLSVSAFCRHKQVDQQSFFRWRKLLALRDQPAVAEHPSDAASPALFLPLVVRPPLPVPCTPPFEVVLRNGRVVACLSPSTPPPCGNCSGCSRRPHAEPFC